MELKIALGMAHLPPEVQGEVMGLALAELAVELRMQSLPIETWCEFMNHRIASLSKQFDTQEQVDAWSAALIGAYQHAMDHDCEAMMMRAAAKIQGTRPN